MNLTPPVSIVTFCTALTAGACGTTSSDSTDTALTTGNSVSVAAREPAYSHVTIPAGTSRPLALTSAVASDTSALEDAVSAELTRPITINGRDVLPAGTRLTGIVTAVDDSNRVKGRASIAFRFTSLSMAGAQYDLQSVPLSHRAPATKGEDAVKIGIGAGAGAVIGGHLGGKDGAAKGAAVAAALAPV